MHRLIFTLNISVLLIVITVSASAQDTSADPPTLAEAAPVNIVVPALESQWLMPDPADPDAVAKPTVIDQSYGGAMMNTPVAGQMPAGQFGQTQNFSYAPHPHYDKLSVIELFDGSDAFAVSESFLRVILRSPMDSEQQTAMLQQYEQIAQEKFESVMQTMYPDASYTDDYAEAFDTQWFVDDAGATMLVEQDPYADPYVRVSIETADGDWLEFSLARTLAARLLAVESLSDAELIQRFLSAPYRLPDSLRYRFDNLSADEIAEFMQQSTELEQMDFIAFKRHVAETRVQDESELAPAATETPVLPQTAAPTKQPATPPIRLTSTVRNQATNQDQLNPIDITPVVNEATPPWSGVSGKTVMFGLFIVVLTFVIVVLFRSRRMYWSSLAKASDLT